MLADMFSEPKNPASIATMDRSRDFYFINGNNGRIYSFG